MIGFRRWSFNVSRNADQKSFEWFSSDWLTFESENQNKVYISDVIATTFRDSAYRWESFDIIHPF